jgi:hypothetical protein
VRIALHQTTEVGLRAARIVLAERDLDELALLDRNPRSTSDLRVTRTDDLEGFDALVSDSLDDVDELVDRALDAGINVCLWNEFDFAELDAAFIERMASLVAGSNLASGIAPCLAAHEITRSGHVMDASIAWTEPGTPLRRGDGVPFPDPVGARWAKRRTIGNREVLVAPVLGEWAAAMARVTSASDSGVVTRIVGVADLAPHLEALALAAGAITTARDDYPIGATMPEEAAEAYLAAALTAGLDVASYELAES